MRTPSARAKRLQAREKGIDHSLILHIAFTPTRYGARSTKSEQRGPRPTTSGEVIMRRVVRTGIVLSALLAWNVISVAQNTTPQQQQPAQQSQTQVAQPTANAAAGASGET